MTELDNDGGKDSEVWEGFQLTCEISSRVRGGHHMPCNAAIDVLQRPEQ